MKKQNLGIIIAFCFVLVLSIFAIYGCGGGSGGISNSNLSTGTVSGYLYARVSGRTAGAGAPAGYMPLSDATVTCAGVSTTTDSNGKYVLINIPAGQQTITATKSGYPTQTFTANVVTGKSTPVNDEDRKSVV